MMKEWGGLRKEWRGEDDGAGGVRKERRRGGGGGCGVKTLVMSVFMSLHFPVKSKEALRSVSVVECIGSSTPTVPLLPRPTARLKQLKLIHCLPAVSLNIAIAIDARMQQS